ncbi:MAG TPA: hypothetical protein VHX20_02295 [Terracidiphilus sp.]|jgi:hypothetical protein|nr:hypothetical protein [Terracidiphilus sp.]
MEQTCNRCHQTVQADSCYCPLCGLPQLVYSADDAPAPGQPERWNQAVRDAGSIDWRPGLRLALSLAVPAGIVCSLLSPVNVLALLVMTASSAWVVRLYMRSQRPAWITIGAGARLGLVTGVLAGWTSAAASGVALYAARYWFHSGKMFDGFWETMVSQQMVQQWTSMGVDSQTIAVTRSLMLSPQGRAGGVLCALGFLVAALIIFSAAGGALGARFLGRPRRPEL